MVLVELFVAALIAGVSCVNAALPSAAWSRSRDARFLLLAAANVGLAVLGGLWAWGRFPASDGAPSWSAAPLPTELLVLGIALLLLAATLAPRRS